VLAEECEDTGVVSTVFDILAKLVSLLEFKSVVVDGGVGL
jgi:hypothetical protein